MILLMLDIGTLTRLLEAREGILMHFIDSCPENVILCTHIIELFI